jgi:hypothetical protein
MTGSWLEPDPALIVLPHNAQIVLPSPFFAAIPFAGRALLFRWRGIETGSDLEIPTV